MAPADTRTGSLWSAHVADLAALGEKARLRSLTPRRGIDFASNDYLAMSSSPRLAAAVQEAIARGVPLGSGGSRRRDMLQTSRCSRRCRSAAT